MMRIAVHCIVVLILACTLTISSAGTTFAQQQSYQSSQKYPVATNLNPDVPNDTRTHIQVIVLELLGSFSCHLSGINPLDPAGRCLGPDPTTGKIGYVQQSGGGIGAMGSLISASFNIPVSSRDYIADAQKNFGITKKAYAQTTGFDTLNPVLPIWKTFRDLTYVLFVLAFVLIGVGIMFRIQIDPRTVMSVQNQIPKVIIALLLVTFSYAIAGFLIDLMWIAIYMIINVFSPGELISISNQLYENPIGFFNSIFNLLSTATTAAEPVREIVSNLFKPTSGQSSNQPLVDGVLQILGTMLGYLAGLIAFFVFAVAIFITLVRVWFSLLKAYVYILLDVIFAPFWIISGLLPAGGGVGPWLRDLVANLSAFPVTILLFLLGRTFVTQFSATTLTNNYFIPPLIGNPGDPRVVGTLVGIAIILITPEALAMTKEALKAPEFKYLASVGKAVGTGGAIVGGPIKGTWGRLWRTDSRGEAMGALATRFATSKKIPGWLKTMAAINEKHP